MERLADDPPRQGGKAAGLARLVAAGLPVPPTLVVPVDEPPGDLGPALALGEPLIVRSSATCEDRAPGLFLSVRDVRGEAALGEAIARVRASVHDALAQEALRAMGLPQPRMAVIIQPQRARHGLATRLLSEPEEPGVTALVTRAEAALGGPLEIEWVSGPEGLELVQARAYREAPASGWPPAEAMAFTRGEPGVLWRWDAAHDPFPLSPAQAQLVARVDAAAVTRARLAVIGGYLYWAPRQTPAPPPFSRWRALWAESAQRLRQLLAERELAAAVAAYVTFAGAYDQLTACIATARRLGIGAPGAVQSAPPAPWGWDVAQVPVGAVPVLPEPPGSGELDEPALAQALAEHDDALFAAAQIGLRCALDREAVARGIAPAEAAWKGLDLLGNADLARLEHARAASRVPALFIQDGQAHGAPGGDPRLRRARGVGGRARGPAVVIREPGDTPPAGAIAVVPSVWPGFAACFRQVAGLVAEHGGLLGHGVALARELGVPCVVGVHDATRWLAGQPEVVIDGTAGLVLKTSP